MITNKNTAIEAREYSDARDGWIALLSKDYAQLFKLRLSVLVVFSAVVSYIIGAQIINWWTLFQLTLGGFLITAASNGINQIIERDLDKKMSRTKERPLPAERMSTSHAVFISAITGLCGALLLLNISVSCSILGVLALLMYTGMYTPMKRKSPFAVFIGAFPGAIPPLLGWVAATGEFGLGGWILFGIQFMWQFPHFWSLAWVLDDDYKKAGFKMLPSPEGRSKGSAFQVLIYTLGLLPVSLLPLFFKLSTIIPAFLIGICGVIFVMQALKLYRTCDIKAASRLMFGSFLYLPVVLIILMIDRFLG